jgi:general L-amino acid transport system substrate-binding protein
MELNIADFFRSHKMDYKLLAFDKNDEVIAAYEDGRCDAYSTDQSGLYALRLEMKAPDDNRVLPEIISKEPLGPVVRQGDDAWFNIVKWTYFALVNAEELGITSKNVEEMKSTSADPEVQRLLGVPGPDGSSAGFGIGLGLEENWAENAIKAVGNYGEIFERNVGEGSPLKIARGKNALWMDGGLQYTPPVR